MTACRWCQRRIDKHRITGAWVDVLNQEMCVSQWGRHPHLPEPK